MVLNLYDYHDRQKNQEGYKILRHKAAKRLVSNFFFNQKPNLEVFQ